MVINMKKFAAIITFVGKPNVGKSTLFNAILNYKWAITSHKPQTTRKQLCIKFKVDNESELLLVDTPGFHEPRNKLDLFLNSEIKNTLQFANVACFIFDITRQFDIEDEKILKHIQNFGIENKILIINKAETSKQEIIDNEVKKIKDKYNFNDIIQISALHKINIDKLINILKKYLKEDIDISFYKEPSDEFITSEIIREKCIYLLKREIPYGIGVEIFHYKYDNVNNTLNIDANIIVEKDSQKPIVIGKGAKMIKEIGIRSRKELLEIYDCKIVLKLFVKVKKEWRNNEYIINELGYKK